MSPIQGGATFHLLDIHLWGNEIPGDTRFGRDSETTTKVERGKVVGFQSTNRAAQDTSQDP